MPPSVSALFDFWTEISENNKNRNWGKPHLPQWWETPPPSASCPVNKHAYFRPCAPRKPLESLE